MTTEDVPEDGDQQAARRERRWRWGTAGTMVLIGLVGAGVAAVTEHASTYFWLIEGAIAIYILIVLGVTTAVLAWRRRRGSRAFARSPLWEVGFAERNRIIKAIRRGRPLEPRHQDLALRTARHILRRGRWPIWAFGCVTACYVAAAVFNSGFGRILDFGAAGCFLLLAGDFGWTFSRARNYVRGTSPTPAE